MNKKNLLLVCCLVLCELAFALPANGGTADITGKIIDEQTGEDLGYVTVSLIDATQKIVSGTIAATDGTFRLDKITLGVYTLKVTFIGYIETVREIQLTEPERLIDLGLIAVRPNTQSLNEVVITVRRPTIVRQMDKLVMTVANTIMAQNSTAYEILRKSPGLAVDKDGNITLNGKSVAVWVDNRPTQLSGKDLVALLEGTDGSSIEKIEIIDQPSSKYDAEGNGGIINIISKKTLMKGFNGSVRTVFNQYLENEYYYRANGSLNLNYRNDLINAYFNAGYGGRKGFDETTEIAQTLNNYDRTAFMHLNEHVLYQNLKAGVDFFIDKKNIIGIIGHIELSDYKGDVAGTGLENNAGTIISSDNWGNRKAKMQNISGGNLNYSHYFDDSGHELTFNIDLLSFQNTPYQYMHTIFRQTARPDSIDVYINNSQQQARVWSGKADYILPIGEKMKLEAGGKLASGKTNYEIIRSDLLPDGWITNVNQSNDLTYNETIGALYATLNWKINEQWNVKGGLRWEYTGSEGIWHSMDSLTSKSYGDFFPTMFVGYNPFENHSFVLSYTRRLGRPKYWNLSPVKYYFSAYSYTQGNPELTPEYSHNIALTHTAWKVFNIGFSYYYGQNQIVQIPVFDPVTFATGYQQGNFGKRVNFGLNASLTELPLAKWWNFTAELSGSRLINEDGSYKHISLLGYGQVNNTFLLGDAWKMELSGKAVSGGGWSYFKLKPKAEVSLGAQKSFWENKGSISLYFNDIFASDRNRNTSDLNGVHREIDEHWHSRSINLAFSYRFGGAGKLAKQRKVGEQEEAGRF